MGGPKKKNSKGKAPTKQPKQSKAPGNVFLEQQQLLPPMERMAAVRPMWESLTQEERNILLTVDIGELQEYAKIQTAKSRALAEADAQEALAAGQVMLALDTPLDEVLETAIDRAKARGTWKSWCWPPQDLEFYDSESFRKLIEDRVLNEEQRAVLPREMDGSQASSIPATETKAEAGLRERMVSLLTKVQEQRIAQEEAAAALANSRRSAHARRQDTMTVARDAMVDLIMVLVEALEQEHEALFHHCTLPVTAHLCEIIPEAGRKSNRIELHPDDLRMLHYDDVVRIYDFLTERVDALSSRLKPDPKDLEAGEEEDPIGDVDLFSVETLVESQPGLPAATLKVNDKWLGHLRSRVLGGDGQPKRATQDEDPQRLGLILEWVYGTIVSTAEKARDAAHRSLGTFPPSVEAAVEALKDVLDDQARWEKEAKASRELLANMLQSRKDAAAMAQRYDMRLTASDPPIDLSTRNRTNSEGREDGTAVMTGSENASGNKDGNKDEGEGGTLPELPNDVIIFMLRREALLTSAKLHYLKLELLSAEKKLRVYKAQLRQGEPQFERLKRELEEAKSNSSSRSMDGTFRSTAEMERHRAQAADAAIEEQISIQTAVREAGARLQKIYDQKQELEIAVARREQEMKQLGGWKRTVCGVADSLEELMVLIAPLGDVGVDAEGRDENIVGDVVDEERGQISQEQRALIAAVKSATKHTEEVERLRANFHSELRRQLYTDANDKTFFATIQAQLRDIEGKIDAGRAAIQHLEAFVINVACDDPGIIVGGSLILPFLQERLDARALEWAAKKAAEAEDAILKMESEREERQRQERERKAKARLKAKEKARSEKEKEKADREVKEQEAKAAAEAEAKQRELDLDQVRRRRVEELERKRQAEEEEMERRRQELLADEESQWGRYLVESHEHEEARAAQAHLVAQECIEAKVSRQERQERQGRHKKSSGSIPVLVVKRRGDVDSSTTVAPVSSAAEDAKKGVRGDDTPVQEQEEQLAVGQDGSTGPNQEVTDGGSTEPTNDDDGHDNSNSMAPLHPGTPQQQALQPSIGPTSRAGPPVAMPQPQLQAQAQAQPVPYSTHVPPNSHPHPLAHTPPSGGDELPYPGLPVVPLPPVPIMGPMAPLPAGLMMPPMHHPAAAIPGAPHAAPPIMFYQHQQRHHTGGAPTTAPSTAGHRMRVPHSLPPPPYIMPPPPPPPPPPVPRTTVYPAPPPPPPPPRKPRVIQNQEEQDKNEDTAVKQQKPNRQLRVTAQPFVPLSLRSTAGDAVGTLSLNEGKVKHDGEQEQVASDANGMGTESNPYPGPKKEVEVEAKARAVGSRSSSPRGILDSNQGSGALGGLLSSASVDNERGSDQCSNRSSKAHSTDDGEDEQQVVVEAPWVGVQDGKKAEEGNERRRKEAETRQKLRGLTNAPGLYNCFLNSVIQCLWQLITFRKAILSKDEYGFKLDPSLRSNARPADIKVWTALRAVFEKLDKKQGPDDEDDGPVSAGELREALSSASVASRFELREMHDAAEVLGEMFERLHRAEKGGSQSGGAVDDPTLPRRLRVQVHPQPSSGGSASKGHSESRKTETQLENVKGMSMQKMNKPGAGTVWGNADALKRVKSGLQLSENSGNGSPGVTTVQRLFGMEVEAPCRGETELEVSASGAAKKTFSRKGMQGMRSSSTNDIETMEVLRYTKFFHLVSAQGLRESAPKSKSFEAALIAAAGGSSSVERLLSKPSIITLSLVWEAAHVPAAALSSTFEALSSTLDASKLFLDAMYTGQVEEGIEGQKNKNYSLRAMACYASSHYYALVLCDGHWLLISDADISLVGGWQEVGSLILAKRLQPSLLFYEAVE